MTDTVLLDVQDLKVAYGGIQAVKGVDLEVREGELVSGLAPVVGSDDEPDDDGGDAADSSCGSGCDGRRCGFFLLLRRA